MQFVKLVSHYYLDPAVSELSDTAEVAFTRSIAYCGAAETGGFIPAAVLPSIIRQCTAARARKVASELVVSDLWVEVPGGWLLRTWEKNQSHMEKLLERRRSDAERQRRHRQQASRADAASRDASRDAQEAVSRDNHVTVTPPDIEIEKEKNYSPPRVFSPERNDLDREGKAPRGRDGNAQHLHHQNAKAWCITAERERKLPIDAAELLAWCYRLGEGDPWVGHRLVDRATTEEIDSARDPLRAVRARLRAQQSTRRDIQTPAWLEGAS